MEAFIFGFLFMWSVFFLAILAWGGFVMWKIFKMTRDL